VVKGLFAALIPLGLLVVTRYIGLTLSKGISSVAIGLSLLWAAITIVSMIDPQYRARITEIQSVISAFRRNK
jgi:hypothetical protein